MEFKDRGGVTCFTEGTRIATPRGMIPVEDLRTGDPVQTMDNGIQPVRWIGMRRVAESELNAHPHLCPIRVSPEILGRESHASPLLVSAQHRVLVKLPKGQDVLGEKEILVTAKHLLGLDGVETDIGLGSVVYYHILFDTHEIIFANGVPAESLFLGKRAITAMTEDGLREIEQLFPELNAPGFAARMCRFSPREEAEPRVLFKTATGHGGGLRARLEWLLRDGGLPAVG